MVVINQSGNLKQLKDIKLHDAYKFTKVIKRSYYMYYIW